MFKQDSFFKDAAAQLDPARCMHCRTLRQSTNVLEVQRVAELSTLSGVNLGLSIGCVMYLASAIVCLIFNSYDNDCYPCEEAATSDLAFHLLEFSSAFLFSLITTVALVYSPERKFTNPTTLKVLVLANVCASRGNGNTQTSTCHT